MHFHLQKIKIRLLSILLLGFTLFFGFFQVYGGQTLQTNHEQKVESLLDLIESGTDANLQAVYSNPKSKELFIELLEMEKLHAQKNNKFALVQQIEEGIVRVSGAGKYSSIDDFWAKIAGNIEEVKDAFTTSTLKYAQEDMFLFRYCSNGSPQLSNWYTDEILTATQARIKLALPNSNTAQRVIKIKVPKGTAYVEGGVASQVGKPGFGPYATGNGKQFYFLDEDKALLQVIDDTPNPLGN